MMEGDDVDQLGMNFEAVVTKLVSFILFPHFSTPLLCGSAGRKEACGREAVGCVNFKLLFS